MSVTSGPRSGSVPQWGLTVKVPSKSMCRRILEAAKATTASVAHAEMVEELAFEIAERIDDGFPGKVDLRLVTAGAMLHEMGTSREKGLRYIMAGVGMAHQLGLDPRLIEVIRRHKGAGMGYAEAARIGLPLTDLVPRTLEELIVSHADLLIEGDRRFKVAQVAARFRKANLPDCAARIEDIHQRLSRAADEDVDRLGPQGELLLYESFRVTVKADVNPGPLLVKEDDASYRCKREHYRARLTRFGAVSSVAIIAGLLLLYMGSSVVDRSDFIFLGVMMFIIPLGLMSSAFEMTGNQGPLREPLKVYSRGIAYKAMTPEYVFVHWSDLGQYRRRHVEGLGDVLEVSGFTSRIRFLSSMREYDVVEATLRRNLVEVASMA